MPSCRILIVEDEAVVAADIAIQCSAMGYQIAGCLQDGPSAIRSIEADGPDLILMDIHLKHGMDGIETALEIRRRFRTPVIFLTAYAEDETLERARAAEPYGYVIKPFRERDLKSAVEVAIARRAAETALRDSEERFRQLAENIEEVFWIGSMDWSVVYYVNPAYETVWGRSCGSLRENPGSWLEAVAEEDRETVKDDILRMCRGDFANTSGRDFRIGRPDGTRRWIHARVYPIRDGQGRIIRTTGVAQDISERMVREGFMKSRLRLIEYADPHTIRELLVATLDEVEALTESRLGFIRFLEEGGDVGALQAWSTNTSRTMGMSQASGRFSPPEWADVWNECVREGHPVVRNDYAALPDRKPMPSGHPAVSRVLVAPVIRAGKVLAVIGVANRGSDYGPMDAWTAAGLADLAWNLAEKKLAVEALRAKERSMEALLGNMPGMAYRCRNDDRWTMEFVSEGSLNLFGYPARDLLGDAKPGYFDLVHPDDLPMIREEVRKALEKRQQYQITYRIRTKSGKQKWVWEQGIAVSYPMDGPEILEGFIMDVTENKELEARLLHSQKMDAFGQLAGGVAHDFNNILAATMIHLDLLAMRTDLDEEIRASINEMQENATRGANLTRQLLLFSRRSAMETRPLDINEVVTNMSKILGRLIGEHIEMRFFRGTDLPLIEADTGMLEQVLMNLAVNARDAMPKGGRIVISTQRIEVDAERSAANPERRVGCFLCLSVSDTGHGMEKPVLERIFEPFFTTKEAGKGTGMGLATVHGIVAQHKGWIEVESAVGQGTTFRVHFPALTGTAMLRTEPADRKEEVPSGRETILLVEDERIVRGMIAESLGSLGYRVLEAVDGLDAMEAWEKHGRQVDLLLTDMVMPRGMTGMELAERLMEAKPQLKVIVTSGYSGEIEHSGAPSDERISFLAKPYDLPRLARLIRICLDKGASVTTRNQIPGSAQP